MARIGIYFAISPFFCRFDGSTLGIFTMDLRIERKEFACQDSFNLPRGGDSTWWLLTIRQKFRIDFDDGNQRNRRCSLEERKKERKYFVYKMLLFRFIFIFRFIGRKERKGEHFSKWNRALSFRKILSLKEISLWSLKHEICNCDIKLKMMSTDFFKKNEWQLQIESAKKYLFIYIFSEIRIFQSRNRDVRFIFWRWIWFSLDC